MKAEIKDKVVYMVMGVAPSDRKRKFTADKFVPLTYEAVTGILFLARNRKNGIDRPHVFKTKTQTQKAIRKSIQFFKRSHKTNPYKIWPLTII